MSVKYSWSRQNGAAVPPVRFMSIEPAEDYYKGMPLKLKEKGIVEPTDGDPEYICMAQYDPDAEIQPLEIPVQEVFPDVVYDRMNDDGTIEEVRFGSKGGGGGDLLETVETEVPLVITWDGDLTGKETASTPAGTYVKVLDTPLTVDQLVGSTMIIDEEGTEETVELTSADVVDSGAGVIVVFSAIFSVYGDTSSLGFEMSTGVWFAYQVYGCTTKSLTCPNATTTETKQQIKTELLPPHKHKWDDLGAGSKVVALGGAENASFSPTNDFSHSQEVNFNFVAGASYLITWDGEDYECVGTEANSMVLVGNLADMTGVDTGEPFCMMIMSGSLVVADFKSLSDGVSEIQYHNFYISKIMVDTIPQKFMPELTQVILISHSGKKFKTTVDDSGQLITTEV